MTQPVGRVGVVVVEAAPGGFSGGMEGKIGLYMGKLHVTQWCCYLDIDTGVVLQHTLHHLGG